VTNRTRVVLETLLPDDAHPVLTKGLEGAGFERFYEEFSRSGTSKLRFSFRLGLFLMIWVAPLMVWRLPPLSMYKRTTRERALNRFLISRITVFRQIALTVKLVVSLCYGADRDVRDAIGYPPQHDDPPMDGLTS
jgi:hypothetical protein